MKSFSELTMPAFYCPAPSAVHPKAREMDAHGVEWLVQTGIAEPGSRMTRMNTGGCVARAHPNAIDAHANLVTDVYYWTTVWDSMVDATPAFEDPARLCLHIADLTRVLETPDCPPTIDGPFPAALLDIRWRIGTQATRQQAARIIEGLHKYFDGVLQRISHQRISLIPSLGDYFVLRVQDSGAVFATALIPFAGNYELSDAELNEPSVRALTETAWLIASMDNDILSRHHNPIPVAYKLNSVDLFAHEQHLAPEEALPQLMNLRDGLMVLHLRLRDQILTWAGESLRQYAYDLISWIRGVIEWSLETRRYRSPIDRLTQKEIELGSLAAAWADKPASQAVTLPPIPQFSWWRDQLRTNFPPGQQKPLPNG